MEGRMCACLWGNRILWAPAQAAGRRHWTRCSAAAKIKPMGLGNLRRTAAVSRTIARAGDGTRASGAAGGVRAKVAALRVGASERRRRSAQSADPTLAAFALLRSACGSSVSSVQLVRALLGLDGSAQVFGVDADISQRQALRPELVAAHLDQLLALDPGASGHGSTRAARRTQGAYYTPSALVELLLQDALDPLLERAAASSDALTVLRALRIVDPACGSGAFLWAAAQRVCQAAQHAGLDENAARALAVQALCGIDIDALALQAAQVRFSAVGWPVPQLVCGDALLTAHFPDVAASGGFDLVLGNPPFANAMEHGKRALSAALRVRHYPELTATSDLSHAFVVRALRLVRQGGRVGFVLPRSTLSAEGAAGVRRAVLQVSGLLKVRLPERCDLFGGADVHVCLLTLGREHSVECAPITEVEFGTGTPQAVRCRGSVRSENWWAELQDMRAPRANAARGSVRLDALFDVTTTFFVHDFYALREHLEDARAGTGPALITTGLIEPGESLWGKAPCRYAKQDRLHPRLVLEHMDASLRRKVERQLVPKILVAGLARRVEALLDREGALVGAIQTFMITPRDAALTRIAQRKCAAGLPAQRGAVAALEELCEWLNSGAAAEHLRRSLGANALSGGNISLRPDFLRALPLPASLVRRVFGAQAKIALATSPCTSVSRKSRPA